MCGIVGLHLKTQRHHDVLGRLLTPMLDCMETRGSDSAGLAIYDDPVPSGFFRYSLRFAEADSRDEVKVDVDALVDELSVDLQATVTCERVRPDGAVLVAPDRWTEVETSLAVRRPDAAVVGFGRNIEVVKDVGTPREICLRHDIHDRTGYQGIGHTRMATESAVTAEGSHPFSVGPDQCLVHNGSFSNHMSVKHTLEREGIVFDSENDTEVGARFVAGQLAGGVDLEKALLMLNETFDGFYTLLVSNKDSFAVVRDAISCKPAVIAETDRWVAMASEYRALADLPGIDSARIFEPEPEEVYVWHRQ